MSNIPNNDTELSIYKSASISADDVLSHLYAHIFPTIEKKYFSTSAKTKRNLYNTFHFKNKIDETIINQQYNTEMAKSIFDFVVDNDTTNMIKVNLLLDVYYKYMLDNAYMNTWLDINNVAKIFLEMGQEDKSMIIKKCLELNDERFYKGLVSITISEDYLMFKNGYGTTLIKNKKD